MSVRGFYVHTVTSSSRPFHEDPTFEFDTVEHPLHLCYFIIQFIGGNTVTEYNNLLKNVSRMPITFFLCIHTVQLSFHINL